MEVKEHGLMNVQVIAPFKEGTLGTKSLNAELSDYVNPHNINEKFGFRLGDKVMQLYNDYSKDVFNGETGIVEDFTEDIMYVRFTDNSGNKPNVLQPYKAEELFNLQMAYACTCHKSQGAEYPVVFVILEDKYGGLLLTRKLLYTAISRGKQKVYVYSMGRTLEHCIMNTYEKPRVTKLETFLKSSVD
jgi:exodeoxyribonuclease V alpha subunit